MTQSNAIQETELFSLTLNEKKLVKISLGLIFIDGVYHLLDGLGIFTAISNVHNMPVKGLVNAIQMVPINWISLIGGLMACLTVVYLWHKLK